MTDQPTTYRKDAAPWPKGDWDGGTPTLAEVIRFWAALGTEQASISVDLVGATPNDPRWRINCEIVQHAHDVVFLLQELHSLAPDVAARAAHRIWLAAEAGDYGEWLWQWAHERGLDCERITAEARQLVENVPALDHGQDYDGHPTWADGSPMLVGEHVRFATEGEDEPTGWDAEGYGYIDCRIASVQPGEITVWWSHDDPDGDDHETQLDAHHHALTRQHHRGLGG